MNYALKGIRILLKKKHMKINNVKIKGLIYSHVRNVNKVIVMLLKNKQGALMNLQQRLLSV
jgi:hypothetical protein